MLRLPRPFQSSANHQQTISKYFGADGVVYDGDAARIPETVFVLAFTNRCGSNYTADRLVATDLFRGFHEQLNSDSVVATAKKHKIKTFPDYIEFCHGMNHKPNRLFGIKASTEQLLLLYRWNIFDMFRDVRILHVQRRDVVAQGVSFSIANQTKRWSSLQKGLGVNPVYDYEDIDRRVNAILKSNLSIDLFCQIVPTPSRKIFYEDVVEDETREVSGILEWAGFEAGDAKSKDPKFEMQRDELNEAFSEQYRQEAMRRMKGIGGAKAR